MTSSSESHMHSDWQGVDDGEHTRQPARRFLRPIVLASRTSWHISMPPYESFGKVEGGFCISRTNVCDLLEAIEMTVAPPPPPGPLSVKTAGQLELEEIVSICQGIMRSVRGQDSRAEML